MHSDRIGEGTRHACGELAVRLLESSEHFKEIANRNARRFLLQDPHE
jgi:hypothetical protein